MLRRIAFCTYFYIATTAVLLSIYVIYKAFGLAAMWGVVFLLILLCLWTERRRPLYFESTPWLLDGDPLLPPPRTPLIDRSPPAITTQRRRALPGPKR